MGNTTELQRREAVLRRAVETHQPYKVFKQKKSDGFKIKGYCIVYTDPPVGKREMVIQDIENKKTAKDVAHRLSWAWAQGYTSSIVE